VVSRVPGPADGAAELAVLLSIAVRIEPELIRAIRLAVLPQVDVAAESDLWFGDLIGSRGPDSVMLRPELLPGLRGQLADRLAGSAPGDPIWSVGAITTRIHASASPALLLEERVAWLAAAPGGAGRQAIEDELRTALYALQVQGRTGLADWVASAWTRLPESVRATKTAWQLRQAAGAHVDMTRLPLEVVPEGIGVADLAGFVADVADVPLGVRLADGELEIGDIGAPPGAAAVPTLDTDPRIIELLAGPGRAGQTIAVPRGGRRSVTTGPGPARLLTPRGLVYQVTPYVTDYRLVPLAGSERQPLPDAVEIGPLDGTTQVEVTLVLRRRSMLPAEPLTGPVTMTRAELAARYGADPADIARVQEVLSGRGLTITSVDESSRRMHVAGPVEALARAFGVSLRRVRLGVRPASAAAAVEYRERQGPVRVPAEVTDIVLAVLGLDDRAQAEACVRRAEPDRFAASEVAGPAPGGRSFTAPQVGDCYTFPSGTDGTGQTLAIIELGGGFSAKDLEMYFAALGIVPPQVTAVSVDGAVNEPASPAGMPASIEVAGALAPGANQLVYFAPNTDRGLLDAVSAAVHADPAPTAVCIGWAGPEKSWTGQAMAALNEVLADAAALGVTVCVAAGDGGSGAYQRDGQSYLSFPASSPYALACGGTSLVADTTTGSVRAETAWNDLANGATGGGVSDVFPMPGWQAAAGVPAQAEGGGAGRGVPDVAGNADPVTGYLVVLDGRQLVVGGTGTAAALWAALVCRLAQATGRRFGLLQPRLYAGISPGVTTPGFRDIVTGDNGAYRAGPGWDACTGLGAPDGEALLRQLISSGLPAGRGGWEGPTAHPRYWSTPVVQHGTTGSGEPSERAPCRSIIDVPSRDRGRETRCPGQRGRQRGKAGRLVRCDRAGLGHRGQRERRVPAGHRRPGPRRRARASGPGDRHRSLLLSGQGR
jgi:kumamolisin